MSKKVEPLFEIINSLSYDKKKEYDFNLQTEFDVWQINRAFSLYDDTIMYANLMNMHNNATKKMHHDFYLYGLRKRKRFSKWPKKIKSDDLELVQRVYSYSKEEAMEALKILTQEQLDQIREDLNTGVVKNKK